MDFYQAVENLVENDPRYLPDAYEFVVEALFYTRKKIGRAGHVSGRELLEGIRELAPERFGPLAKMVLEKWGVTRTEDFGEIVFNLVDAGLLKKLPEDSREDFRNGYDFEKTFRASG